MTAYPDDEGSTVLPELPAQGVDMSQPVQIESSAEASANEALKGSWIRYSHHERKVNLMRQLARGLCFLFALTASGCGPSQPQPLNVSADGITSLTPDSPFLLPANTKLEALNKCIVSFPGSDLFETGDVIGEVVVIDNDALMGIAPNNEKISLHLERGHSMLIQKSRTITVEETDDTPCRFKVIPPDGK